MKIKTQVVQAVDITQPQHKPACVDCYFYEERTQQIGDCRFHPPLRIAHQKGDEDPNPFPVVWGGMWCRCWRSNSDV